MPGASKHTRPVTTVNANWVTGADETEGRFEIMFITEDGERHYASASPAEMSALVALTQAPTLLLWDPADQRLIAANLRGRMPWTDKLEHPA